MTKRLNNNMENKKVNLICLILSSGDEIIGQEVSDDKGVITLNYVMVSRSIIHDDFETEASQPVQTLFKYVTLGELSSKVAFIKNNIIGIFKPSELLVKFYGNCLSASMSATSSIDNQVESIKDKLEVISNDSYDENKSSKSDKIPDLTLIKFNEDEDKIH